MMELSHIRIENKDGNNRLVCDLKSDSFTEKTMWFSAPASFGDIFSAEVYDAFLVAILYPAMYYREDIVIRGAMSKRLFKNITTYVKKLLLAYSDELSDISVTAESCGAVTKTDALVGTGFSAGVDSFATFVEHYVNEGDADYRISALFFFNVGSHGPFGRESTMARFRNRYAADSVFPSSIHLPFIPVDSNVHAFHEKRGHMHTAAITLAAGILSVQKILSKYYVSSALSYQEIDTVKAKNLSLAEFSETSLYPLLSPEGLEIIPDGEQYLRTEKTRLIADYGPARKFLNVCVRGDDGYTSAENCGSCPKCLRTLMALDSMGRLREFGGVFSLATYKKHAFKYKCRQRILYRKDPFARDNVDFARQNGKGVPPLAVAFLVVLPSRMRTLFVRIAKTVLGESATRKIKAVVKAHRAKINGGGVLMNSNFVQIQPLRRISKAAA